MEKEINRVITMDTIDVDINKKEIKITPPEGYEIDKINSTFECIKFKPIAKRWRDNKHTIIRGYYIDTFSHICGDEGANKALNYNLFVTEKQAKSALAMAQISQIMANDERFGGVVTDEEWYSDDLLIYTIERYQNRIVTSNYYYGYKFLAFHTSKQRDLFLEENEDLINDYLMLD